MKKVIALTSALLAAACTTQDASPLIFGQGITVGISVGASATNTATPELVVGLKRANIAIVPTVIPKDVPLPNDPFSEVVEDEQENITTTKSGQKTASRNIRSFGENKTDEEGKPVSGREDALSTFGSFSNTTSPNCVTLGVFFATGVAAQNISDGFKDKAGTVC